MGVGRWTLNVPVPTLDARQCRATGGWGGTSDAGEVAIWADPRHGVADMLRFWIFGFHVAVEPWFWLTCFLMGGGLQPQAWSASHLAGIAIWAIVVFFSILVHELGHAFTGRRFGANPEIVLHAFGGAAVMHGARFNRRQDLLVTAAGPGASVVLGTLALLALLYLRLPWPEVRGLLVELVWINYCLLYTSPSPRD